MNQQKFNVAMRAAEVRLRKGNWRPATELACGIIQSTEAEGGVSALSEAVIDTLWQGDHSTAKRLHALAHAASSVMENLNKREMIATFAIMMLAMAVEEEIGG